MRRARASGFTLIELVIALTLLAVMLSLLWGALNFAVRSWDTGEARAAQASQRRLSDNFLRREMSSLFPMRWRDANVANIAFEGEKDRMRFASTRAAGLSKPGISIVGLALEENSDTRQRDLVMRRALPPADARDFTALDQGDRTVLVPGVERAEFAYFGTENDLVDGSWRDAWTVPTRIPQLVKLRVKLADGTELPDFVVAARLGEEAGCFENSFQRTCGPRK
jgi:general secretion pathway protein J